LLVLFIVFTIIFALSWDIVYPWEIGILIDNNTRTYDNTTLYSGGRYYTGLGRYFFKYPITFQVVEFANSTGEDGYPTLTVFTSGGQTVYLDVFFYYRIDETKVVKIFDTFKYYHDEILIREAQDLIKIVCGEFTVDDFFSKRQEIATEMSNTLNEYLYPKYHVWIALIQLLNIALPSVVEESRVQLVVASQDTKTAQLNREIILIQKETEVLKQNYTSSQTIVTGQANSEGYKLEQAAIAEGNRIIYETEAAAWQNFTTSLGLNVTHLMTYSFIKYLKDETNRDSVIVGFDNSVPIIIG